MGKVATLTLATALTLAVGLGCAVRTEVAQYSDEEQKGRLQHDHVVLQRFELAPELKNNAEAEGALTTCASSCVIYLQQRQVFQTVTASSDGAPTTGKT